MVLFSNEFIYESEKYILKIVEFYDTYMIFGVLQSVLQNVMRIM